MSVERPHYILWDLKLSRRSTPEDGDSMFLRNVGIYYTSPNGQHWHSLHIVSRLISILMTVLVVFALRPRLLFLDMSFHRAVCHTRQKHFNILCLQREINNNLEMFKLWCEVGLLNDDRTLRSNTTDILSARFWAKFQFPQWITTIPWKCIGCVEKKFHDFYTVVLDDGG
jgi:hypothetical protein